MRITRVWTVVVQSVAIVGQTVVPDLPVAEETRALIHSIIAALQGVAAVVAHNFNPDGTPVQVAYRKPSDLNDQGER